MEAVKQEEASNRAKRANHATPEWYTPPHIIEHVRAFYGGTFFDPCPASFGHVIENGLAIPWRGHVYCNPPYGKDIKPWVAKAMTERCSEVIMLVPAYTDTQWYSPFYEHTICFIRGRVKFLRRGMREENSPNGSVLVYRGRRHRQFAEAFCDLGPVMRTYVPMRAKQPTLLLPGEMALEEAV